MYCERLTPCARRAHTRARETSNRSRPTCAGTGTAMSRLCNGSRHSACVCVCCGRTASQARYGDCWAISHAARLGTRGTALQMHCSHGFGPSCCSLHVVCCMLCVRACGQSDTPQPAFKTVFYIDFLGSLHTERVKNALRHLSEIAPQVSDPLFPPQPQPHPFPPHPIASHCVALHSSTGSDRIRSDRIRSDRIG